MKKCINLSIIILLSFFIQEGFGQDFWKKINNSEVAISAEEILTTKTKPTKYDIVKIDKNQFENEFSNKIKSKSKIISLPTLDGSSSKFRIMETPSFATALQKKYPEIRSYTAYGIDDPTATAKISEGTDGMHITIFSGNHPTIYLDPYSKDREDYMLYSRLDLEKKEDSFKCGLETTETSLKDFLNEATLARTQNNVQVRTYRLAIVAAAGYSLFHLNRQNVSVNAPENERKAAVLSALNASVTRINGIFEKDLGVRLELVANNDDIIFFNEATDGITDGDANEMIEETQIICDNVIGNANYDIGHVFSLRGSGLAGLGVVCATGDKAKGVTGISQPIGDPYDIDFVIHELGHQFGATHTQNNECQRTLQTAVEPGSGSTIMGYAGICAPNVIGVGSATGNSDDHFHAVSIAQMKSYIQSSASCATLTNNNNTAPVADAGLDYNIPRSTPFKLTGSATDAEGLQTLTYNWEQIDNEVGVMPPLSSNSVGPMFRSLPSKSTPVRYFPNLETVLAGSSANQWEVVPGIGRDLNFAFTVRDNHPGGGASDRDDVRISVINVAAFQVNTPNTQVSWEVGSSQTISWVKGRSDLEPINCKFVNIKLSLDGGKTFPVTLKENTPNDGSEIVVIPNNTTNEARVLVEAVDNIFFNINPINFTINSTAPTFIIANESGTQNACNLADASAEYELNLDFVNGFNDEVTLSTANLPTSVSVNFSQESLNTDGNTVLTISNLEGLAQGDYNFDVIGTSQSLTQQLNMVLRIKSNSFDNLTLSVPSNGIDGLGLVQELSWKADSNATVYEIQVALDAGFTSLIDSGTSASNSFTTKTLNTDTTYFWRVKPKNECGEGNFSTPFSFTTTTPTYCTSEYTDESGGQEHITNVTFGSINNNSGNETNIGYQDFTNISTTLKRGDTEQISVTFDTAGFQDECFIFIDWNRDFVFDPETEKYSLGRFITDVATANLNITVPDNAVLGSTRMRVIIEYFDDAQGFSPGDGACDSDQDSEWGETEDYTIIVEESTASVSDEVFGNFRLFPNPSSGLVNITFNLPVSDKVEMELFDIRGRRIERKSFQTNSVLFNEQVSFTTTAKGIYLLRIKSGNSIITKKLILK